MKSTNARCADGVAAAVAAAVAVAALLAAPLSALAQTGDAGLQAWSRVHEVFSHPRCANCHVDAGAVPIWSGPHYGPKPRPHGMNVKGGSSRIGAENGLLCTTCHAAQNAAVLHGPPGAPVWLLAPVSMQWWGKSSAEICAQVKDPARNGGRTLQALAEHVAKDDLVAWGWKPGPGRQPAPYSAAETATFIKTWAAQGAPCPAP